MNTPQDGGPAFPVAPTMSPDGSVWYHGKNGMSLRDWFAGMAISGAVEYANMHECDDAKTAANYAYRIADAMLAVRERKYTP